MWVMIPLEDFTDEVEDKYENNEDDEDEDDEDSQWWWWLSCDETISCDEIYLKMKVV